MSAPRGDVVTEADLRRYLEERGPGPWLSSRHIRCTLQHCRLFLNRRTPSIDSALGIDEALLIAWLRDLAVGRSIRTVALAAGHATPFLDFLVAIGRLRANPLATLWAR